MKIEMTEIEEHKVLINGVERVVRTARVANGWVWTSHDVENPDGAEPSREAALRGAVAELTARAI